MRKATGISRRTAAGEYSAGGVVTRSGKVLLVKVRNLRGEAVWTLPKGHLEAGETPRRAALREVEEETGWRCRIVGPLPLARYMFTRNGRLVRKLVRWYRMVPEARTGVHDAGEILAVQWATAAQARKKLRYHSDLQLMRSLAPAASGFRPASGTKARKRQ